MLVGFHAEGNDWLVLRAFLAKLLVVPEGEIECDRIDLPGIGWQGVLGQLPLALKRFYGKCAQMAVVALDNDGNEPLLDTGAAEDPRRPRHWNHATPNESCRYCQVDQAVTKLRRELDWDPSKPGAQWPVVACVPVEMIESWLLVAQAVVEHGRRGSLHAERESRSNQKLRLFGRPIPTREDVEKVALPLVRSLLPEQIETLASYSLSFKLFVRDVASAAKALGPKK